MNIEIIEKAVHLSTITTLGEAKYSTYSSVHSHF